MSELDDFRAAKDDFFVHDRQSPLSRAQRQEFKGLNYFPENPALRLEVQVEPFPQMDEIEMQTSTGDVQRYTRYGRVKFTVDGQAPRETYGAGRYLEPEPLGNGTFLVDFNYAYNPYCAYNDAWSCPLTPFENRVKVPIKAGEKNFHE